MSQSTRERNEEPPLQLSAWVDGVELTLDPPLLRVDLEGLVCGVSPKSIDPLGHTPRERAAFTVFLQSHVDEPRIVTLREATIDARFDPGWAQWSFVSRSVAESEGSVGAEAQDVVNGGSLSLLVRKEDGQRRARIEFAVPLSEGIVPARILFRLSVECRDTRAEMTSALLVRHPESRLLSMLPGLYQEAMEELREEIASPEAPFFKRYLVGFQDALDPLRAALGRLDALFGPYSTPPDFLVWLAAWVCMPLDENWPEMKRRRLVAEAVELFRWRGTKRGLSRFLEIYTGFRPTIHDQPHLGAVLGTETRLGDPRTIIGDVPEHTFTVTVVVPDPTTFDEKAVRRIIESEKPAHAAYRLIVVRPEAGRNGGEADESSSNVLRHPKFGPDAETTTKAAPGDVVDVPRHPWLGFPGSRGVS